MTQPHTNTTPKVLYERESGREWTSFPVRRTTKAHAYMQIPPGRIVIGWIRNSAISQTPVCDEESAEASVPLPALDKHGRAYATTTINGRRHKFRVCTAALMLIEKAGDVWRSQPWLPKRTPQLVSYADCEQEIVEHAAERDADPCVLFVKELAECKSALRSARLASGERGVLFPTPKTSRRHLLDIARQSAERRGIY